MEDYWNNYAKNRNDRRTSLEEENEFRDNHIRMKDMDDLYDDISNGSKADLNNLESVVNENHDQILNKANEITEKYNINIEDVQWNNGCLLFKYTGKMDELALEHLLHGEFEYLNDGNQVDIGTKKVEFANTL